MSSLNRRRLLYAAISSCAIVVGVAAWLLFGRPADPTDQLLSRAVLDIVPDTASGDAIDPLSLLVSIASDGTTFLSGERASLSDIETALGERCPEKFINTDPVLLEAAPSLSIADLNDVLEVLIVDAGRTNIAFLVRTPEGLEAVTLPVSVDHGCLCLLFYDGKFCHDDHAASEKRHVWLRALPGDDGKIEVTGISVGLGPNAIVHEDDAKGDSGSRDEEVGEHPALGTWRMDTLGEFVGRPRADGLTVFVSLGIKQADNIQRVLSCLASVKAAIGHRVVARVQSRSPESQQGGENGNAWWQE